MDFKSESRKENIYLKSRLSAGIQDRSLRNRGVVAEMLHISYDSLFNYESGKTVPNEDMVFSMAELYGNQMLIVKHFMRTRTGKILKEKFGIDYQTGELSKLAFSFIDGTLGIEIKRLASIVRDCVIRRDKLLDAEVIKESIREITRLLWELNEAEANLKKVEEKPKTALASGSRRKLKYAI